MADLQYVAVCQVLLKAASSLLQLLKSIRLPCQQHHAHRRALHACTFCRLI